MTSKRNYVVCLLLVLLILAAVAWYAIPGVSGRRRPAKRIILISIDTCRADYVGCYNPDRRITPNIDAFAQQATLLENVRTPVPITLPAHCSMLTGLVPPTHGVRSQPGAKLSRSRPTMASVLRGRGYSTGAIVSSFVLNAPLGLEQGFDSFNGVPPSRPGLRINERRGQETSRIAIKWLGKHKDDEKFFLFVHYYDPHLLYGAPAPLLHLRIGSPSASDREAARTTSSQARP
jgi:arylsulfatase A-like enzyme